MSSAQDIKQVLDAIDHLQETFVICDADDRIVYTNRRFRTLNAAIEPMTRPGTPYVDFLRAALANRLFAIPVGREAEWLEAALERRRRSCWTQEFERVDGTWTLVRFVRLQDGRSILSGVDITELKRAEAQLLAQTERLKLGQSAAGMIVMDWDIASDTLVWSDSPEWLRGPLPPGGTYPLYREQVHPEDRDSFLAVRAEGIRTLARHDHEYRVVRTDGRVVWVRSQRVLIPGPDGRAARMIVAIHDVTARKAAEQRAREANERLRAAIEDLNEWVAVTDSEDRILVANRRFRELTGDIGLAGVGLRYEEYLVQGIRLGRFPDAVGREAQWLEERLSSRRRGGSLEVRHHDGTWWLVTDQPLPRGGTITFALDITARKRADQMLHDVNVELERRVAERTAALELANRDLESFSYAVSHDLRAPLRAMSAFSELLLRDEAANLSADGRRRLGAIQRNAVRMSELIDALLALARLSRQALQRAEVDMEALARGVCSELGADYPEARIDIASLPPVHGDATLLRQALFNLVSNALKYSSRARAPRVEIAAADGAYVVRDNGIGFDMAHAAKLFQSFERLHGDDDYPGTGIGLAIAKLIVERHGGRIDAQSEPGRGASFRFALGGAAGGVPAAS